MTNLAAALEDGSGALIATDTLGGRLRHFVSDLGDGVDVMSRGSSLALSISRSLADCCPLKLGPGLFGRFVGHLINAQRGAAVAGS